MRLGHHPQWVETLSAKNMVQNRGIPMPDSLPDFSIESLALPHEDPGELTRILKEFTDAYPASDPIIQGLVLQAVIARVEIGRLQRISATVRTAKVRTALRFCEQS